MRRRRRTAWHIAAGRDVEVGPFTVTFLTGTTPANITLGANYAGPGDASLALYDSGDGVWHEYTSKTIPVVGDYVAFKGDWRTSGGIYRHMFNATFQSTAYTCKFSGMLDVTPDVVSFVYSDVFRENTAVTSIEDNPLPILAGSAAQYMYYFTYRNMSNVEGALPDGFMDTSNLTGSPAASMFHFACTGMSSVTSLPAGFMDTSGLTGAPAANMFLAACQNMSSVTNSHTFNLGAGITFTAANVVGPLHSAFRNMGQWGGQVMWGTDVLVEAIPVPDSRIFTFLGSTNMPNYDTIDANWK